jgi:Na+-transporting NADH:ubiquinone oxidoreductase subunit NqrA
MKMGYNPSSGTSSTAAVDGLDRKIRRGGKRALTPVIFSSILGEPTRYAS